VAVGVGTGRADASLLAKGRRNNAAWLVPCLVYLLIMGGLGITTKLALEELTWSQVVLWTTVTYAAIAIALFVFWRVRIGVDRGNGYCAIAGVLAVSGLICFYLAVGAGEVSRVIPITSAYPVVTLFLAALTLSERVTAVRLYSTLLVVGGVVLISLN
jgi:bacterial/archaeal transporter family protein